MDKQLSRKKVEDEIMTADFSKLNGAIIRTIGLIFHGSWEKASNVKYAFKEKSDAEFRFSLDYLQLCGAIKVRVIDSTEEVEINDFDLDEVEIRLSAYGIKLWRGVQKDELIEI